MYQFVIEKQAQKQLGRVSMPYYQKIADALRELVHNPRPHGYKKLKGRPGYRIRIGDYRVIYMIEDSRLVVYIIEIDNRKDIYKK